MPLDIRKTDKPTKEPVPQVGSSQEDPVVAYVKANRHLFGPFRPGTIVEGSGNNFHAAEVPDKYKDKAAEEQATEEVAARVGPDTVLRQPEQPLKVPEPVSFNRLPIEKQQAIAAAQEAGLKKLQDVKVAPTQQAAPQVATPQSNAEPNPGLPSDMQFDLNITDFLQRDRESMEEELTQAQSQPTEGVPSAGGLPERTHCQHCGWELTRSDPGIPDEMDKLNFIQSVLGQIPFKKTYSLLGGRIDVTFRTLSSEESDMTFTQVAFDAGHGDILDEGQYFRTLTDYRLSLGLATFKTSDGVSLTMPESLKEWETDKVPPKATKLVHIVPWLYEHVLKSESVKRAVGACYFRFQRTVENMESHLDNSDFWPAIERQA